jgi:hypothetical protein
MAVSASSTALKSAAGYSNKWHQKRIHRKLDDRDDVLDEALQLIEEHDTSVFPVVTAITGFSTSKGSGGTSSGALSVGGAGCTASSTVTLTIGATDVDVTPGTNTVAVDTDADVDAVMAAATVGDHLPVYLRVDGVLCPVLTLKVTT